MWWEPSPGGVLDKAPYGLVFVTQQISLILTHLESANTWKMKNHFKIAKTYLQGKTAIFIVFLYHIPKSIIKYGWTFCFLGWSAHRFSSNMICICPHSKGFKNITWVVEKKVNLEVELLMIFICQKSFPGGLVLKLLLLLSHFSGVRLCATP